MTVFSALSASDWAALLADPDLAIYSYGQALPKMPPESLQIATSGRAGLQAMAEASDFYHEVKKIYEKHGDDISAARVFDFGCGWGRVTRAFLKDIPPYNIIGSDVRSDILSIAGDLAPSLMFAKNDHTPPLAFVVRPFDIIVSYSVFSHLPENLAKAWIDEFATKLRPGGVLAITTRGRNHIIAASKLKKKSDQPVRGNSHANAYENMFNDFDAALKDYDSGKFVFAPTGGGKGLDTDVYGEAIIPAAYVKSHWADKFEMLAYVEGYSPNANQPIIMMRRR